MSIVRACTPSDMEQLKYVDGQSIFNKMHPDSDLDPHLFLTYWKNAVALKAGALFVEVEESHILGLLCVQVYPDFFTGSTQAHVVCWHSVGPNRLGLLRLAEDFARKHNCKYIFAHSLYEHARIEKLLRYKGYVPSVREYSRRLR